MQVYRKRLATQTQRTTKRSALRSPIPWLEALPEPPRVWEHPMTWICSHKLTATRPSAGRGTPVGLRPSVSCPPLACLDFAFSFCRDLCFCLSSVCPVFGAHLGGWIFLLSCGKTLVLFSNWILTWPSWDWALLEWCCCDLHETTPPHGYRRAFGERKGVEAWRTKVESPKEDLER